MQRFQIRPRVLAGWSTRWVPGSAACLAAHRWFVVASLGLGSSARQLGEDRHRRLNVLKRAGLFPIGLFAYNAQSNLSGFLIISNDSLVSYLQLSALPCLVLPRLRLRDCGFDPCRVEPMRRKMAPIGFLFGIQQLGLVFVGLDYPVAPPLHTTHSAVGQMCW